MFTVSFGEDEIKNVLSKALKSFAPNSSASLNASSSLEFPDKVICPNFSNIQLTEPFSPRFP